MTVSLATLRAELQQRLGDTAGAIWTSSEIDSYIQEGYDQLTKATGCLLGVALAPDYAFAFSYTASWEYDYILAVSGWWANGPAQFNYSWERDYLDNADGPANHNYHWEYNGGFVTTTEVFPLIDLPDDLHQIERSTWNTKRTDAYRSQDVEWLDSRYELNKGIVEATIQDKDGLARLRKWRVPSTAYVPYSFDDGTDLFAFTYTGASWEATYIPTGSESNGPAQFTSGGDFAFIISGNTGPADHNYLWEAHQGYIIGQQPNDDGYGIIRDLTGIVSTTVVSDGFGDLIQVDGVNVFEDYGILGPVYKEISNLRIEYQRRGLPLSATQDFEIPDRYTVYVRHYAQARALEREGSGQELKLAAHYQARYEAGVARMLKRKQAMQYQRQFVIGGGASIRGHKPPRPKLPWQYGSVVR